MWGGAGGEVINRNLKDWRVTMITTIKKVLKISLWVIAGLVAIYLMYAVPCIYKLYKINVWQNKIGETLPDAFRFELPVTQNPDGYFCVKGIINDTDSANFIMDTQTTSLAKMETINDWDAMYWGKYPVPVYNSYGQKEKFPLYFFNSFNIQSLSLNKPLFTGVSKSNAMYDLMDHDVVGKDILKQLFWKFSLDDGKMILFSNRDTLFLRSETESYVKIENGLTGKSNHLFFPDISIQADFILDIGYAGEIMVNKEIFSHLSNNFPLKKFVSSRRTSAKNDTTYVFDGMNVEWDGIKIPNCQITYSPITNRNLIGVKLVHRFNFALAYSDKTNNSNDNIYLQPRNNFQQFESAPYCSDFGFDIRKLENIFIINRIETGGLADKAGINVKDKIVRIDHGNFDLNDRKQLDSYLSDKKSVSIEIEKEGKIIDIELIKKQNGFNE